MKMEGGSTAACRTHDARRRLIARQSPRSVAAGTSVVLLLAAPALLAQSTHGMFRHEIAAGKIAEECRRVPANAQVRYSFVASDPVDFNVHLHRGDAVEYPLRKDAIKQDFETFVAPSSEEFCWMWTNRNAKPVTVQGELRPT